MTPEKFQVLCSMLANGVSYDAEKKRAFRALSQQFMREVAQAAGLKKSDYDVRFNAGGIAVSGDAILHHERVYVMLNADGCKWILVRSCNGRRDYHGGGNKSIDFSELPCLGIDGVAKFVKEVASS